MEKIINHVVLNVSVSLKSRETLSGKPLLHKYEYSLVRDYVWNYSADLGILSYLEGSTQTEISMAVHQCAQFFNSPRFVHERDVRHITKYLTSTPPYMDLPYGN